MAVGGDIGEFDIWLNNKLLEFNTDEGVFGSYIKGILEGEESLDDKTQALEEILSEITENNITKICQEIIDKWKIFQAEESVPKTVLDVSEDVEVKLARLMENQAKATTVIRNNYTDEERKIREAILSQYGQMSDNEDDAGYDNSCSDNTKENGLVKNTNASSVQQAEREKREKAKIESQRKKEKDKEDREKQKQLAQEKKEKRKTQKGERRR
ncbi:UNVERIFIED_CONTAM: hypothetical protein PYX00_006560 [Menopon gallinae]|uniref:Coiled-coil domain-containing protein 43 n=1 Tax=Menopon gallinae TaxID=328185 RepID=A0AAW2HVG2_9NEOP